jgi:hypothetical protein
MKSKIIVTDECRAVLMGIADGDGSNIGVHISNPSTKRVGFCLFLSNIIIRVKCLPRLEFDPRRHREMICLPPTPATEGRGGRKAVCLPMTRCFMTNTYNTQKTTAEGRKTDSYLSSCLK